MFVLDLLFALIIAVLLTWVFGISFRKQSFGSAILIFFFLLFLLTWAGGIWVTPFGPLLWGVSWLTFVIVGIVFAFVLTAILPWDEGPYETTEQVRRESTLVVDGFFWSMIFILIIAILASYV